MDETDKILQALQHMDQETLKNTLAYLLKVYVIDKKVLYDGAAPVLPVQVLPDAAPLTFTKLITEIKRNYQLEELKQFSIEGGRVYITLEHKRYLIAAGEETNTQQQPAPERAAGSRERKKDTAAGNGHFRNIEMDE